MFVIANFIKAAADILSLILGLASWLVFLRAIISWVNPDPYNPVVQFLYRTTEPLLAPIRRFLPGGRIDVSPIIAFLIIVFLQSFLVASLRDLSYYMRQNQPASLIEPTSFQEEQQGEIFK